MTMLAALAPKSYPTAAEPENFSAELMAAVATGDAFWREPTAEDHQWAAQHLNRDWHAAEPSPFELSLWSPEVPADVWEAEAEYRELARLAEEAEEAARVESGHYAW